MEQLLLICSISFVNHVNYTMVISVQCGSLDTTVGMSKQYSSDGKQSIATFTCDSGYTLLGSSVLSCHEDGAWNIKIKPKCGMLFLISVPYFIFHMAIRL